MSAFLNRKKRWAKKLPKEAATYLRKRFRDAGRARLLFSAANSQLDMVGSLGRLSPGIDWNSVEVFHVDEYVGLSTAHPRALVDG